MKHLLPFALIAASTAFAWQASPAAQPVVDWIRGHAIPLATVDAGHGFDDMEPLKKMIGDARVVELGEATHGSSEFFRMKHRMLEFLVTQMGFTVFSMEAGMPEAERINEYVLTGKGDPKALLKRLDWTWDTEEVLSMIEWMRGFNESGKGHVEFTGFDMQNAGLAEENVTKFISANDPGYAGTVKDAVARADASGRTLAPSIGNATFPVAEAAGRHVHYSGYVRTEGVTVGYAGLWWRVDGKSGILASDTPQNHGVTGTTDWKKYDIDLTVPSGATNINFGVVHEGNGTAWFDNLTIELDGKKWNGTGVLDLDFESAVHEGFRLTGPEYEIEPDGQIFQSGKYSLRTKFTGAPVTDPKTAPKDWEAVISHLEGGRDAWIAKGLAAKDVDWAIQNARLVLQSLQLRTASQRDQNMASDVQWILDEHPGARTVVWAHNQHVNADVSHAAYAMGGWLRKAIGSQMVAFGFAFNEGSFRAQEPGKAVRDFIVPPSPAGSLDATFAAAGIPLFALDLRQTPESGPVEEWFGQAHQARTVGAAYLESRASDFLLKLNPKNSFDAMIFVEKTTAAHANSH